MYKLSSTETIPRVRVLVIGDSDTGKSSLVQLITNQAAVVRPQWTVGCSVEISLHDYRAGTPNETPYFVELWDVGGSASHANARSIFYQPMHGLILVHDLSNRKTHDHLDMWLREVVTSCTAPERTSRSGSVTAINSPTNDTSSPVAFRKFGPGASIVDAGGQQLVEFLTRTVPILIVGTKIDQTRWAANDSALPTMSRNGPPPSRFAITCNAEEMNVDCRSVKTFAPGSTNALKLSRFLDRVVEAELRRTNPTMSSQTTNATQRGSTTGYTTATLLGGGGGRGGDRRKMD